ncbi:MAG: 1,4-dihydroxy-6-naphtoate synthase [Deltaproteobacteria bacterium ADurb.Bin510]|nr:MAG: 1,4-dihydroxy-6-naphtoate synthase [Deltaproteobacteria bacterium ADurb.Bin510]
MPKLSLALSTCPNDTFSLHALLHGLVDCGGYEFTPVLSDVEDLNQAACEGRYDVTKLSYHAWLRLKDRYDLLASGSALGFGCGPLIVARDPDIELATARIAVPGAFTTALLLLRLKHPEAAHIECLRFDEILPAVAGGRYDAGLLIHEGRFVYQDYGLSLLADLGQWWEATTGCPIPLGCYAIRKELSAHKPAVEQLIRSSIAYALAHPDASRAYVRQHAQELSDEIIASHIRLYVNEYSLDLGETGRCALSKLEELWRA